jgi:hypothetical protein
MMKFQNNQKKVLRAVTTRLNKLISKYDEATVLWAVRKWDKDLKAVRSREKEVARLEKELSILKIKKGRK